MMPEKVVHFQIRMPPSLYARLTQWARNEEQSLNSLIGTVLEIDLIRHENLPKPTADRPSPPPAFRQQLIELDR